jgi:hypothetical protein
MLGVGDVVSAVPAGSSTCEAFSNRRVCVFGAQQQLECVKFLVAIEDWPSTKERPPAAASEKAGAAADIHREDGFSAIYRSSPGKLELAVWPRGQETARPQDDDAENHAGCPVSRGKAGRRHMRFVNSRSTASAGPRRRVRICGSRVLSREFSRRCAVKCPAVGAVAVGPMGPASITEERWTPTGSEHSLCCIWLDPRKRDGCRA